MVLTGITLLIIGVLGTFASAVFIMLNLRKSVFGTADAIATGSPDSTFDGARKAFGEHIYGMISAAGFGAVTIIGIILIVIGLVQRAG